MITDFFSGNAIDISSNIISYNSNIFTITSFSNNPNISNTNLYNILINNNNIGYNIYSTPNFITEYIQIKLPYPQILQKFKINFSKNTFRPINFNMCGSNDTTNWVNLTDMNICKSIFTGTTDIYCNLTYTNYLYFRLYISSDTSPLTIYYLHMNFQTSSNNLTINSIDNYSSLNFNNEFRIISEAENNLIFLNNKTNNEIMRLNNNGLVISNKDSQNNNLKVEKGISIGDDSVKDSRYIGITNPIDGQNTSDRFSGMIIDNSNNKLSLLLNNNIFTVNDQCNISNFSDLTYKLNIKDILADISSNNIIPVTINTNGAIISEYNMMSKNDNRVINNITNQSNTESLYYMNNIQIINYDYSTKNTNSDNISLNNGFDLDNINTYVPKSINTIQDFIPKPFNKYNFNYISTINQIPGTIEYSSQINILYILNSLTDSVKLNFINSINNYFISNNSSNTNSSNNIFNQLIILSKINNLNTCIAFLPF